MRVEIFLLISPSCTHFLPDIPAPRQHFSSQLLGSWRVPLCLPATPAPAVVISCPCTSLLSQEP